MSKFYRNKKGFLASLTKGSGLYLTVGATGLVLICLIALVFSPDGGEQSVSLSTDGASTLSDSVSSLTNTDFAGEQSTNSPLSSDSDSAANATVDDPQDTTADVTMIVPVSGTVETDFSSTVPVFSETMNDWRVHQGIDYLTEASADVVAAADGIVENVYVSELMGMTVEILHEDGTISVYQSLAEDVAVIEGQEVLQGDLLGKTGNSADSECLMGTHLHFALIRNGVYLNPNDRFAS